MKLKIRFIDSAHRDFYFDMLDRIRNADIYRMVFFYVMGILPETRNHIAELYDFGENCISLDTLDGMSWETFGTRQVCYLAYNLYNGFCDPDHADSYTPYYIFCSPLAPFFICAIYMLYTEYFTEKRDTAVVEAAVWK